MPSNPTGDKGATLPPGNSVVAQGAAVQVNVELSELAKFREGVLKDMLVLAAENYKEAMRIMGVLDGKAQKTGGVAGVFLAAGLAFLKPDTTLGNLGGKAGLSLLALGIVLLLVSIGLCVKVMWVESSIAPPSLFDIERLIDGVFGLAGSGLTNKLKENFIWDQCTVWKATLLDQIGLNESKARWLHAAQGALALAMLAVGLLLFFTMLRIVGAPRLLSV